MFKKILLILIILFGLGPVFARDTTTIAPKPQKSFLRRDRNWTVEIPIWIPGFRGNFAYGDVSLEGEDGVDPGEPGHPIEPPDPGEPPGGGNIISRLFTSSAYLKFFFMGGVSYTRNKFLADIDMFSGGVGGSVNFKFNNKEVVSASYRTALTRIYMGYAIYERENKSHKLRLTINGYAGARVHYMDIFSDLNRIEKRLELDFYWTEPLLGLQNRMALKNWLFLLQGDIGSFYSGKNYSYMISAFASYRLSHLLSLKFGWNSWEVNLKRIIRDEQLVLRVQLAGPTLGLVFHF